MNETPGIGTRASVSMINGPGKSGMRRWQGVKEWELVYKEGPEVKFSSRLGRHYATRFS